MSKDQMYLRTDSIGPFEAQAQYPPFAFTEPAPTASNMPGVAVFNQAALAAVARGKEFDTAACTGVESFKQITRRCGVEYQQNDVREATDIARTAATQGSQVLVVDENNKLRGLYPGGQTPGAN